MFRETNHGISVLKLVCFQKNGRDFEKLGKALNQEELTATLGCMTLEQRHAYLETEFEEHLKMYNKVIDRLVEDH